MDAGRGSYICGLVLGMAVGVAGAHLALSGRPSCPTPLPTLSIGLQETAAGLTELPTLERITPELKTAFAPEPTTVHAIATAPIEAGTGTEAAEPPRQLPMMTDAEPLQTEQPREDVELRAFIRDELKTLAASEHQIWYETLHGLSREDATEILKIWKLSRGFEESIRIPGLPQLTSLTTPEAEAPVKTPVVTAPEATPTTSAAQHDAIQQACLHNLANAATPGFKSWEVMMFERSADGVGKNRKAPDVWINQTAGKLKDTGRPFDLAVQFGFFKVRRGNDCYLTRCGRFVRTQSAHLALPQPNGDACRLEPEIVVPENCELLQIGEGGIVTVRVAGAEATQEVGRICLFEVFDPSALRPEHDNLFAVTSQSGPVRALAANRTGVYQGCIEESNVDPAAERLKLEALSVRAAR
ncbi:MAG TPA: hypothetical protein VM510_14750 [Caulifigura sp.]|nr:hypothetical protein [Caulifigura sp.]